MLFFFCFCSKHNVCVSRSMCTTFGCVFERCEGIHDQPWTIIVVNIIWTGLWAFLHRLMDRSRIYCYSIRSYTCRFHSFLHQNKGGVINMRRKPFKIQTHTNELCAQHQSNAKRMETILRGGASFLFIQLNRYSTHSLSLLRAHIHIHVHNFEQLR